MLFMELYNLIKIDLISINVLVELLVLPPVLVQLILDVLDVLADVVMGLIRRLLEAGQLLLQPLVHLDIIIVNIMIIVIIQTSYTICHCEYHRFWLS